jgi:two-component system, chemotaxis family, response regulator Rcp1
VLAKIKRDPDLKRIPVVSLTSSAAKQDILQIYHLHAIGSVTKAVDLDQCSGVIRSIEDFWLRVASLPPT